MTESQFSKNIKKWFFGSLLTQIAVMVVWAIYTSGTMNASVAKNSKDIDAITEQMDQKADVQMVLRIKSDQDMRQQTLLGLDQRLR